MRPIISIIVMLVSIFTTVGCKSQGSGAYGSVVSYSKGKTISFPDFDMVYTGETSKTSKFDNGNSFTFHYQNFTVSRGSDSKNVQWTSGTGEIYPIPFDFGGAKYTIELSYCEALKKRLDSDEMVITKVP